MIKWVIEFLRIQKLVFANRKQYKHWRYIVSGKKIVNLRKTCGYWDWFPKKGKILEMKMNSGKVGLYETIDFKHYSDPNDMIEWALICL